MSITADEGVLSGQPRIDGTRVSVLQVYETVVGGDTTPAQAAAGFEVSLGEVHEALAYYYNNPEEMSRHRSVQERALEELQARAVKPPVGTDRT